MSKSSQALQADDAFGRFFAQAEDSLPYWVELAKLEFTEKVIARMQELGLTRSALAVKLGVQPGLVTRLLSGRNNFELGTMTKIARALGCDFRCHLQPKGTQTLWINVLNERPSLPPEDWSPAKYRNIHHPDFGGILPHETLCSAA